MKTITFILFTFLSLSIFAQDAGSLNSDAADASSRSGSVNSDGESDSSDSNSRNQGARAVRPNVNFIPPGVRDFAKTYHKSHLRFLAGDILSSAFFETTGLFSEVAGDSPLETAIDRTFTLERNAGLLTFLSIATSGNFAIDKVENQINKKLGVEKTHKKITQIKNLAGVHILAGVYGYIAVDAMISGKSSEEISEILQAKETLALAGSMHLAFSSADKFMDFSKETKKKLSVIKDVASKPHALKIARQYSSKTGLELYSDLLRNGEKLDKVRRDINKAKVTVGATQPHFLPAIIGETIVEWTVYYVFAKVWDNLIHESLISLLNEYDKNELKNDMFEALCYAQNQGNLHYEEKVIKAAQVISQNIQQLYELMHASVVDQQLDVLEKTTILDYYKSLHKAYFELETISERNKFVIELLDNNNDMYKENFVFINSLVRSLAKEGETRITEDELKNVVRAYHSANSKPVEHVGQLNLATALDEHQRKNKRFFVKKLNDYISLINESVEQENDPSKYLKFLDKDIANLEKTSKNISKQVNDIAGMTYEEVKKSHMKYEGLSSNQSLEEIEKPQSVYELILVQKIYTDLLEGVAVSDATKEKLRTIQQESELALYLQTKNWQVSESP